MATGFIVTNTVYFPGVNEGGFLVPAASEAVATTIVPLPQTPGVGLPVDSPKRGGILLRTSTPGQVSATVARIEQRQRQNGIASSQERTYEVSEGVNVIRHGLGYRPTGRIITLDTAGFVGDSDLSSSEWRFTVLASGLIRVRWQ